MRNSFDHASTPQDDIDAVMKNHDWVAYPVPKAFDAVEKALLKEIKAYGADVNGYGAKLEIHSGRVAEDGHAFLLSLGIDPTIADLFKRAMHLHDLGKKKFPPAIWDSAEAPTKKQQDEKALHTVYGPEILKERIQSLSLQDQAHPFIKTVLPGLMSRHHERMDGQGHRGLHASQLGLFVRVACIVDYIDGAMNPKNKAKHSLSLEDTLHKMVASAKYATAFDPNLMADYVAYRKNPLSLNLRPSEERSRNMVRELANF